MALIIIVAVIVLFFAVLVIRALAVKDKSAKPEQYQKPEIDLDRSRIVCFDKVVLSEEEMAEIHEQARQRAIEKATEEARRKLDEARKPKVKPVTATTTATEQPQLDLFGGM